MNDKDFVYSLLNNAFDYLQKSSVEFENEPKYSLINFFNAVEIFLKARLVAEHWSLIVESENISYQKFKDGESKTLDFEQLCKRINGINQQKEIDTNTTDAFNSLRKERNKLIHFTHNIVNESNKQKKNELKEKFAVIELRAWYYLKLLLSVWTDKFGQYDVKTHVDQFENRITDIKKYIDLKYEAMKPIIEQEINKGKSVIDCVICGKHSAVIINKKNRNIQLYKCFVCENEVENYEAELKCRSCNKIFKYNLGYYNIGDCIACECGYKISSQEIIEQTLEQFSPDQKRIIFQPIDINCGNCDGYHSVVRLGDMYMCVDCGYIQYEAPLVCECCNEAIIGLSDCDSLKRYIFGCGFCEGYGNILGII